MNCDLDRRRSLWPAQTLRRRSDAVCRRLLAAVLFTVAPQAWAVTCTVSSPGVSFGSYNTFSAVNLDITGTVTVTCTSATPATISLSTGAGTYAARKMTSGARILNYNLYTNAARTTVWGDGTAGTSTGASNGTNVTRTVYGRIPALQNAFVGSYSDAIIVTIVY